MAWRTIDEVADAAYGAGFKGEALAIAIAVTKPEAGMGAPAGKWADDTAVGDTTIQTDVYGPSVGAWQVRTIKAEKGKSSHRDYDHLYGRLHVQAQAAYAIAGGNVTTGSGNPNRGWGHWSVFKDGKHRPFLADARAAAARREGLGGNAPISGGGLDTDTVDDADRSPNVGARIPVPLPVTYIAPRRAVELVAHPETSAMSPFNFGEYVIAGEIDLTVEESSQLSLELYNPAGVIVGAGRRLVELRSMVRWRGGNRGLRFTVAAIELAQTSGDGRVLLTCRDFDVDALKRTNVSASGLPTDWIPGKPLPSGKDISPTEYAQLQARGHVANFVGEGSARRADITPNKSEAGVYESPWEVMNRLADELGYLCFISDGTLYFGRPSWLTTHAVPVKVGLSRNAWGDPTLDAVDDPTWRDTVDDFHGAELTVHLPRWRGEQVRPGMKLVTQGLADVRAMRADPTDTRRFRLGVEWLVTGVRWPVDDGRSPVTVTAMAPIDPPVVAKTGPEGDSDTTTTPRPAGGSNGSGSTTAPTGGHAQGGRIGTDERRRLFGREGDEARYKTVATPWGISVRVHADVAARFVAACNAANAASSWRPKRIDGYVLRNIAGTDSVSLHSFALAWDFFVTPPGVHPPGGVWAETSAPDKAFRDAFKAQGFHLGADFSRRKDFPHIEWASAPPPAGGGGA